MAGSEAETATVLMLPRPRRQAVLAFGRSTRRTGIVTETFVAMACALLAVQAAAAGVGTHSLHLHTRDVALAISPFSSFSTTPLASLPSLCSFLTCRRLYLNTV